MKGSRTEDGDTKGNRKAIKEREREKQRMYHSVNSLSNVEEISFLLLHT